MIEILTSTRVQILSKLSERPYTASEIARITGYSKATVSYHLGKLSEAGLVERIERGKWVYYRITAKGVKRMKLEVAISIASIVGAIMSISYLAFTLAERGVTRYAYKQVQQTQIETQIVLIILALLFLLTFLIVRFRR